LGQFDFVKDLADGICLPVDSNRNSTRHRRSQAECKVMIVVGAETVGDTVSPFAATVLDYARGLFCKQPEFAVGQVRLSNRFIFTERIMKQERLLRILKRWKIVF